MLRPSAFQNNGSAETASSSKSILRPSSFQLAPSTLSTASNSNNKSECNEPSTTSHSDSPFELKEEKQSTSTSNESTKEDDSKISSTTNTDGDNNGENSDETKVIPNPFNNSKVKGTELDEDNDETDGSASKPSDDDKSKQQQPTQEKKSDLLGGKNLFAANTKSLFASAASKSPFLAANNGSENSFVFGQNIHERIVGVPDTSVSSASSSADDNHSDSSSGSKLFAVSSASTSEATSAGCGNGGAGGGSTNGAEPKESSTVEDLTKVAREYEESRVQKRKLDAVETFTGEENEVNVVDMSSRLFAFVASNYEQRGPGSLRLNDVKTDDARSRVVFRTLGNFRVLLNTKVWGGMIVEKPSQKSLRFTAIDSNDGAVKIYLVMARPDDINTLYSALKKRIEIERKREKTEESTSASSSANDEANTSKDSHHETDEQPDAKKDRKS